MNTATRTAVLVGLLSLSSTLQAQWTVTNLHPPGATESYATGVSEYQQVGYAVIGGVKRASLWTGTAASWVDLTPPGATESIAHSVSDGQQVGSATFNGLKRAIVWTGSAASWQDLTPTGATEAEIFGVYQGEQVGWAFIGGAPHAALWHGTPESFVDLHPPFRTSSTARATDGIIQVGGHFYSPGDAGYWSGTAASWISQPLNIVQFTDAVHNAQQAGTLWYFATNSYHAGVWTGVNGPWIDLHPSEASGPKSRAFGVYDGYQVGWADNPAQSGRVASLWQGSPETWENLSEPLGHAQSEALAVWHDGVTLSAVGNWYNSPAGRYEAVLWTRPIEKSCYADCDESGGLDFFDFLCFQNQFVFQNPYADCDGSGGLDFFDFLCFQNEFAAGCP